MSWKGHVRFLGEKGRAIIPTYPTKVTTYQGAGRNDYGGGAICALGELSVETSNFNENIAAHNDVEPKGDGGVAGAILVLNNTNTITIKTSNFTNNEARHGGAITINNNNNVNTKKVTIDKNNFLENTALYGGAINTYQQANITNNNFTRNTVKGEGSGNRVSMGGAIVINEGSNPYTVILTNNRFSENEAQEGGTSGAVFTMPETTLESSNNVYENNKAFDTGVIYNQCKATFTNDTFTGNSADYTGVFTQLGDELTIDNCTLENNNGNGYGDLAYTFTDMKIKDSTINTDNPEKLMITKESTITATNNIVNDETFPTELIKTTLTIINDEISPENPVIVNVTSNNIPVTEGTVTLTLNDEIIGSANVTNGQAVINTTTETIGENIVKAIYASNNGVHTAAIVEKTVTSIGISNITTDNEEYVYVDGEESSITITINDTSKDKGTVTGEVVIDEDHSDELITITDTDGTVITTEELIGQYIKLRQLLGQNIPENYTVKLTYHSNNEFIEDSETSFVIKVPKRETYIDYEIVNDVEGKVAIEIKVYDEKTDDEVANSIVKLSGDVTADKVRTNKIYRNTSLEEGNYTITVTFDGKGNYAESSETIKLSVVADPSKIIDELNETVKDLNNTVNTQNETIKNLTNNITELNNTIKDQNQTINQLTGNITELNNTIKDQNQTINQLTGNITELNNTIKDQNQTINQLTGNITELNNTIKQQEQTINELNQTINKLTGNFTDTNNKIDELINITQEQEKQIQDLKDQLNNTNKENENLNNKLQEQEEQIKELNNKLNNTDKTITEQHNKINELNDKIQNQSNIIDELENNQTRANNKIDELTNTTQQQEKQIQDLKDQLNNTNKENENLNNKL